MGEFINKKTVIDPETGIVLAEKTWKAFNNFSDNGYKYRDKALYIRYYFDSLPANLSERAWVLLLMIAEIMNEDNVLVYRVKRKSKFSSIVYKPMDKEDIMYKTRFKYRH